MYAELQATNEHGDIMISDTSGGDREAFVSACLFSFLIHGYWIHSSPGQSVHGHKSD